MFYSENVVEQLTIKDFTSNRAVATIKANMSRCPLVGLQAATFSALVACCHARRSINERKMRNKINAIKSQRGITIVPQPRSYVYPICSTCKMYEELERGILPKALQHIQILEV